MPLIRRMIMEPGLSLEAATWDLHQGCPIPVWVEGPQEAGKGCLLGELGAPGKGILLSSP